MTDCSQLLVLSADRQREAAEQAAHARLHRIAGATAAAILCQEESALAYWIADDLRRQALGQHPQPRCAGASQRLMRARRVTA